MNWFDRFADSVERMVSHAWFFVVCVVIVVVWAPSYFILKNLDTWQLVINTFTTIVTFLLVALLQNTQERFERAQNERWCALLEHLGIDDPNDDEGQDGN